MDLENSQSKNQLRVTNQSSKDDIVFVQERFNIKKTVEHLHKMMEEVTAQEFTPETVNAACHCVHQLNEVLNTTIKASKFLRNGQ